MNPFDTLTFEQKLQVLIVRIDIFLEKAWNVLRFFIPAALIITLLTFMAVRLIRFCRRGHPNDDN